MAKCYVVTFLVQVASIAGVSVMSYAKDQTSRCIFTSMVHYCTLAIMMVICFWSATVALVRRMYPNELTYHVLTYQSRSAL
jgi:hypothetical protein